MYTVCGAVHTKILTSASASTRVTKSGLLPKLPCLANGYSRDMSKRLWIGCSFSKLVPRSLVLVHIVKFSAIGLLLLRAFRDHDRDRMRILHVIRRIVDIAFPYVPRASSCAQRRSVHGLSCFWRGSFVIFILVLVGALLILFNVALFR